MFLLRENVGPADIKMNGKSNETNQSYIRVKSVDNLVVPTLTMENSGFLVTLASRLFT